MRNNERFEHAVRRLGRLTRRGLVKKMFDRGVQFAGIFRIKKASDGRMPDGAHLGRSFVLSVRFRSSLGARATPAEAVFGYIGRAAPGLFNANGDSHSGDDP